MEDIDVQEDQVFHQHIDSIFYAVADTRESTPEPGEAPADAWEWISTTELRESPERYELDVIELGTEAIDTVGSTRS